MIKAMLFNVQSKDKLHFKVQSGDTVKKKIPRLKLIPLFCLITHKPKAATILNHSTVSVRDPEKSKDSFLATDRRNH